jgi:hypothetical protein
MDAGEIHMTLLQPDTTGHKAALTIPEFCREHRFSVAFFYVLRKRGQGPRVTKIGARRIITHEDAAVWRAVMSAQSAA